MRIAKSRSGSSAKSSASKAFYKAGLLGGMLIVPEVIFCITIIGAAIGVPMILIGLLMVVVGRKRMPIVLQISKAAVTVTHAQLEDDVVHFPWSQWGHRRNPIDGGKMHGRDGIPAHSYMLDLNGQSDGCVSFNDYTAFLDALLRRDVDRLVVVAHLADAPSPLDMGLWRRGREPGNEKTVITSMI
jgi:hypothetical protein